MSGIFGALVRGAREIKGDSFRYGTTEEIFRELFAGSPAKSGVPVNWKTALKVTTVLACGRRIAEGVSTVPVKLYQKEPGSQSRREATEHPLYDLFATAPNDQQDSLLYRESKAFHVALTGNGFSYKSRARGEILELLPFEPGRVTIKTNAAFEKIFTVRMPDNHVETFPASDIWHVSGPSWDGLAGMDAVQLTREAIGLAIATEETHASFHRNGARPGGLLAVDSNLDDAGVERIKSQWKEMQSGVANFFRTIILDKKATWTPFDFKGVDSQHVQLRSLQVEEICRGFGVMPIMVGYSGDKAPTYASAEQLFLAHLVHTVRPWHRRFEASMNAQLLTTEERRAGYYFKFNDAEFLRTAAKDRAEYYKIALGGAGNPGWLTPNQVRAFDEMGPQDGGDFLYAPTNTGPVGADGVPVIPAKSPTATPAPQ